MKKYIIYLFLCILWLHSMSQGSAFVTKSKFTSNPKLIRQYANMPGYHVTYSTDLVTGEKGYIGITDIFSTHYYAQVCENCTKYHVGTGPYFMMLREYDVSNAFVNYSIPMNHTYKIPFTYGIYDMYDFQYCPTKMAYTLLQRYEVSPGFYPYVVTKIGYFGGAPPSAVSDYLTVPNLSMSSMSLSDSLMFVAYGCDVTSNANVFWKDYCGAPGTGACLTSDILPVNAVANVPYVVNVITDSILYHAFAVNSRPYSGVAATTTMICH